MIFNDLMPSTCTRVMLELPVTVESRVQRAFLDLTARLDTQDLTETG